MSDHEKHSILVDGKNREYQLRYSARARRMRLSVYPDGGVVLTLPYGTPSNFVSLFLHQKTVWLAKHLRNLFRVKLQIRDARDRKEYLKYRSHARTLALHRLRYFNESYGFTYERISIRDQRTRWGSCSKKGNLNFNYRIALLPPHLADYIIVHELCHLGSFDHSKHFWDLVARTIPEHRKMRQELRTYASHSLARSPLA